MSNTQKSSVEQFAIALYERGLLTDNGDEMQELLEMFKEMEKEQTIKVAQNFSKNKLKIGVIEKWYNETYGGSNQLCCTPEGQIKRYVNCIGCDRKPLIQESNK